MKIPIIVLIAKKFNIYECEKYRLIDIGSTDDKLLKIIVNKKITNVLKHINYLQIAGNM